MVFLYFISFLPDSYCQLTLKNSTSVVLENVRKMYQKIDIKQYFHVRFLCEIYCHKMYTWSSTLSISVFIIFFTNKRIKINKLYHFENSARISNFNAYYVFFFYFRWSVKGYSNDWRWIHRLYQCQLCKSKLSTYTEFDV